ncbi:uncharacterized protein LOC121859294 isoform X2 [Homarus americanus]|uniref:uncharacterized protein LOC121859294 isoform X2 n=1 Tax=Homarus americanus TaxID=6706 RepID=UPI001C45E07C|nr:uncharacterized protein LOC121859294 isoform X2 [Homarus americanus]
MEENVQPELNFTSPRKHQGSLGKVPSHLTTPVSVRRSPLKDIANNPSELKTVKKDCKQDEESSWRERTEVVTRIDHATYHMFAEEILKEAVSIVTKEPAKPEIVSKVPFHKAVAKFREENASNLGESDSEYESAEELEVDKSSMQRQLSPVLPVANSILNITSSVNCTPNRSDMVFENSLLSSFENMKIADVDEPTLEDNFHDASDSMEGIVKLSPSSLEDHGLKVAETEITKIMNTSFIIVTDGLNDSCDASNEIKEEIESYSATHETREAQSSSENSANVGEFLHDPPVTEVFVDKEEMKEIIPEVKETTPEMKEIIPEQKETIPEKKETIPEVKEIIPEVKEIIPEKKETISEVKEIIPEQKETIPEKKETIPEVKEIIPEKKETIPEVKEIIPEVKEIIPEVKEIIPEVKEIISEKKETISEVKEIIPEQKETIPEKKETIPEVKEIISEQKETIPEKKETILEMTEIIPEVKETIPEKKETIPEKKETIPEMTEIIPEKKETIPDMTEIIPEKKETIPEMKETIPEKKETISEKEETIPEKEETIPKMKETISEKKETIPEKKETIPEKEETIPEKKETIPEKEETIPEKKETIPEKKETISEKEETIPEKKETIPEMKETISEVKEEQIETIPEMRESVLEVKETILERKEFGLEMKENIPGTGVTGSEKEEVLPVPEEAPIENVSSHPKEACRGSMIGSSDFNLDVFETKASVMKSCNKDNGMSTQIAAMEEESCKKPQMIKHEIVGETKNLFTDKSVTENISKKSEILVLKKELSEETVADDSPLSQKGCQMDFLSKLDDPNFNPFATKSAVINSPDKKEGAHLTEDKACVDQPITEMMSEKRENVAFSSKYAGSEKPIDELPPKKCCQLDILSELDGPNSDPFITKSAVVNSPCREGNTFVSEENMLCQKLKTNILSEEIKTSPAWTEKSLENERPPQLGSQMDFLDKTVDFNFDPFLTKAAVVNSPESKGNAVLINKELCHNQVTQVVPKQETVLPVQSKEVITEELMEDPGPPKKNYQLDFLDQLDGLNFDPFTTKTTVVNSPDKTDSATESEKKSPCQMAKTGVISEKKQTKTEQVLEKGGCSQKSYQMDFLDKLGDPNYDPFTTKASGKEPTVFSRSKEAKNVVPGVVPSRHRNEEKQPVPSAGSGSVQHNVFSPLPKIPTKRDDFYSKFSFDEEFTSAAEFPSDEQEPDEGESFLSPMLYPLFNNPEDLDVLGSHGTEGDKLSLVRNSLYVKFDPLVSGRQSLAPYLAQHLKDVKEEVDPRRCSGLISFSPSPVKRQRDTERRGTPMKAMISTFADETFAMDATSLENTTVLEGGNTTVVSSNHSLNNTTINSTGNVNETIIHLPLANAEKMVTEREMNDKLKNMEFYMQDHMLRKSREFEEVQKTLMQQITEQSIAMNGMEEENATLKQSIQQMQGVMAKIVKHQAVQEKARKSQLLLLENKYEIKLSVLNKECHQNKEELKKSEVAFFDLVKKFERLREVSEALSKSKETLITENESLRVKLVNKEENIKMIIKNLEDQYEKAQEMHIHMKQNYEQELKKASVMLKKAEVKILTLTETVEKTTLENQRLSDLIDDITKNMSGS